jgi:hypothetical protein
VRALIDLPRGAQLPVGSSYILVCWCRVSSKPGSTGTLTLVRVASLRPPEGSIACPASCSAGGTRVHRSGPSSRALLLCPPSNHLCYIFLSRLPVLSRARAQPESALAAGHGQSRGAMGESASPRVAHLPGLTGSSPDCPFPMNDESMCKHIGKALQP